MLNSFERLRDYVGTAATLGTGPRAAAASLWHQTKNLHSRPRHDAVLSRLHERGFKIDSEVFDKATGIVTASRRRVEALQPERST
jgi:hypothetical protein